MRPKVDRELLPIKAHFFFFNAGTAPVMPFMPTLAKQLGFSSVVVGTMYTILPIVGMLAKPFFGFIADRFQKHRILFLVAQLITAISFFCVMFIPAIPQDIEFHCNGGVSELKYCSEMDTRIRKILENQHANSTLTCQLNCQAEAWMWDTVCSNWLNNSTDCQRDRPNLDFTVSTSINDIIQEKECLFFKVQHNQGQLNGQNVTLNCPNNLKYFNTTCKLDCSEKFLENTLAGSRLIDNSEAMGMYQFWLFFSMLIISWIGMAVVVSIGDAICFSILGERHHLYGKQRLWGAVGFGIFAILSGVLVDKMSGENENKDYSIVFWITAVMIGFDIFASSKLKLTQTSLSQNIFRDVGKLFLSLRVIIFFVWCIIIGLCTALVWNFLFWHLEDLNSKREGNSMKTLEGFVMGVQCFGGELPFFFLSGWILKKIGHVNAMSLVLLGFGVRFLLYSILENPWLVLPIELLNGVTFGMFYSTMASYASIVAPAGSEATLQGLVGAIFEGVGVSVGSAIGGVMFNSVGGSTTFLTFGLAAMVAFVAHAVLQWLLPKYSKESGKHLQDDTNTNDNQKVEDNKEVVADKNDKNGMGVVNMDPNQFTDIDLNS